MRGIKFKVIPNFCFHQIPTISIFFSQPGKIYSIKRPQDILEHQTELECLFSTGRAPTNIPTGALYGTVISAINTRLFNQIVGQFWKGKTINKTECHGNTAYIGWNNVMNNPVAPFVAKLTPTNLKLAPGEYDNGRSSLQLEYGIDVAQACPEYRDHLLEHHGRAVMRGASFSASSLIPTNHASENWNKKYCTQNNFAKPYNRCPFFE